MEGAQKVSVETSSLIFKEIIQNVKVLEFYSGIGGMHYALNKALKGMMYFYNANFQELGDQYLGEVVEAFDINVHANLTYKANFGSSVKTVRYHQLLLFIIVRLR
jgi:hypothetical protein